MAEDELSFKLCTLCNSNIHITDYFFHFITEHPNYIALNSLFLPEEDIQTYFDNIYNITVNYMLDNNMLNYEGLQHLCDSIGYEKTGIQDVSTVTLEKDKNEIEKEDICSICMDNLLEKEKILTIQKCKHFFCSECILKWLAENKQCPVCKQEVENQQCKINVLEED
jgi:hypothetical protein